MSGVFFALLLLENGFTFCIEEATLSWPSSLEFSSEISPPSTSKLSSSPSLDLLLKKLDDSNLTSPSLLLLSDDPTELLNGSEPSLLPLFGSAKPLPIKSALSMLAPCFNWIYDSSLYSLSSSGMLSF